LEEEKLQKEELRIINFTNARCDKIPFSEIK
jgi:hypothetical protein